MRTEVGRLAQGDLVVSEWTYYIEEKECRHSLGDYPERIDSWIFGWWDGSIPPEEPKISGTEALGHAIGVPSAK